MPFILWNVQYTTYSMSVKTRPYEISRERLIQRENFWVQKLQTLYPKRLNQELEMSETVALRKIRE